METCVYKSYVDVIIPKISQEVVIFISRIKWLKNLIFLLQRIRTISIISCYYLKEKKEYIRIIIKYIYLNIIYKVYIYVLRKINNITIARVYIGILVTQSADNVRMLGGLVR